MYSLHVDKGLDFFKDILVRNRERPATKAIHNTFNIIQILVFNRVSVLGSLGKFCISLKYCVCIEAK